MTKCPLSGKKVMELRSPMIYSRQRPAFPAQCSCPWHFPLSLTFTFHMESERGEIEINNDIFPPDASIPCPVLFSLACSSFFFYLTFTFLFLSLLPSREKVKVVIFKSTKKYSDTRLALHYITLHYFILSLSPFIFLVTFSLTFPLLPLSLFYKESERVKLKLIVKYYHDFPSTC